MSLTRLTGAARGRRLALAILAAASAGLLPLPAGAGGTHFVGLEIEQRAFDHMSVGDVSPRTRGHVGGRLELAYGLGSRWDASLAGYYGGSWFDFNGLLISGNVKETSWGGRLGFDRVLLLGESWRLYLGPGVEYGEARSWLENILLSQEGPHAYFVGGSVRLGASARLVGRLHVCGQVIQSAYHAHARDPSLQLEYNWLGRGLSGSVGLRFALTAPRID